MPSDFIIYIGIAVCGTAVVGAVIAAVFLRLFKSRLNRQFDEEYGKRRR